MKRVSRRDVLKTGLVVVGAAVPGISSSATPASPPSTSFHFDHVLGTSLDVWIVGTHDRERIENVVLAEIERLRCIFSTFDPNSELSRLNRASGPVSVSPELFEVLLTYRTWEERTRGALNSQLGDLVRLWQEAGRNNVEPDSAEVARIVRQIQARGWALLTEQRLVARRGGRDLNLNSVAKGTIIQKAAAAVRARCPEVTGLLLNLGGDMTIWGDEVTGQRGWRIGVQNPHDSADNAPLLTALRLHNRAVASSGGYQRYASVGGQRLSHLIDPRTGRPAGDVAGATVIAPTSTLANLLATTLCVLAPAEGLRLIATTPGTECLIVTADGRQVRSAGFATYETNFVTCQEPKVEPQPDGWAEGRQVSIAMELVRPTTGRAIRRPYVAVWIEDGDGKAVRTLAVWGNGKWLATLTNWWKTAKDSAGMTITRATRAPGKYELVWDGKDDNGVLVKQGTYTIRVETHREHGKHTLQTGKIECAGEDAKVTLEKNEEAEATLVQYVMKKK
jgi:thiamine biosynthesis lipoprotein ApbE